MISVSTSVATRLRGEGTLSSVLLHQIDSEGVRRTALSRGKARALLGIDDDAPLIVAIGNHRQEKDYPTLLRAFQLLKINEPTVHLRIIGDGNLRQSNTALADRLGLDARAVCFGPFPTAAKLLNAADLFVLSSAIEGAPVALMEAIAFGLPIVCTDVGGCAELLAHYRRASDCSVVQPGQSETLAKAMERGLAALRLSYPADHSTAGYEGNATTAERYMALLAASPQATEG